MVPCAFAQPYGDLTVSRLHRVYDGKLFFVDIEGVHPLLGKEIGVTLNRFSIPKIDRYAECDKEKRWGNKIKAFVQERLLNANKIELRNVNRGAHWYISAAVFYDGKDLGSEMHEAFPWINSAGWDWCASTSTWE